VTAEDLIRLLDLRPLPREGGYFRETYRSTLALPLSALPGDYTARRSASTAIYYLLTAETFSAIHRLPGDEVFHFYLGDPVELLVLEPGGSHRVVTLGNDVRHGMAPQFVVPGRHWQGSTLRKGGRLALLGTTMSPGFDFEDFEAGVRGDLVAQYPDAVEHIDRLTHAD
jgi:uncharacterized protein